MELSDSFPVKVPSAQVWDLFWDYPGLVACLPGCDAIEVVDESNLKVQVRQRVGPFQLAIDMQMKIIEVTPGRRIVAEGSGADRRGNRLRIVRSVLEVEPISPDETRVSYDVNFTLFGRLGTLGYAVIKRKVAEMQTDFTRHLAEALESAPEA
jgi:carbon monoxide dehydrogenase subunit G